MEKFEGTFGSSKKPRPEVFQWPHMVTVFIQVPANLLLWSRFSFEGPGRPLQPCEGPFLEVCPTELDPFYSLVMRGSLFSITSVVPSVLKFGTFGSSTLCTAPTHDPYEVLEPPQNFCLNPCTMYKSNFQETPTTIGWPRLPCSTYTYYTLILAKRPRSEHFDLTRVWRKMS